MKKAFGIISIIVIISVVIIGYAMFPYKNESYTGYEFKRAGFLGDQMTGKTYHVSLDELRELNVDGRVQECENGVRIDIDEKTYVIIYGIDYEQL